MKIKKNYTSAHAQNEIHFFKFIETNDINRHSTTLTTNFNLLI